MIEVDSSRIVALIPSQLGQTSETTPSPAKKRWVAPAINVVSMSAAQAGNSTAGSDLFTFAS